MFSVKNTPFVVNKKGTIRQLQKFHKSTFLQKVNCKKTVWDQARLSSLV